jgi:HSP20 family molecular chaperone IbpA
MGNALPEIQVFAEQWSEEMATKRRRMTHDNLSEHHVVVNLHKQVDELFQQTIPPSEPSSEQHVPFNLFETGRYLGIHLGLPGCREPSIRIFLDGTTLIVRAERHVGVEEAHESRYYLVHELPMGTLICRIPLPAVGLRMDAIKAYLAEGMLTVIIPKREEHQIHEVPIHAS